MPTDEFDGRIDDADESDLNRLERRLGDWTPSIGGLDRDRLLFDAGRADSAASDRGLVRLLLAVSLATTLTALGSGAAWRYAHERGGRLEAELAAARVELHRLLAAQKQPEPHPVHLPESPVLATTREALDPSSYLALSRRIANGRIELEDRAGPRLESSDGEPSRSRPEPFRVGDLDRLLDL